MSGRNRDPITRDHLPELDDVLAEVEHPAKGSSFVWSVPIAWAFFTAGSLALRLINAWWGWLGLVLIYFGMATLYGRTQELAQDLNRK